MKRKIFVLLIVLCAGSIYAQQKSEKDYEGLFNNGKTTFLVIADGDIVLLETNTTMPGWVNIENLGSYTDFVNQGSIIVLNNGDRTILFFPNANVYFAKMGGVGMAKTFLDQVRATNNKILGQ